MFRSWLDTRSRSCVVITLNTHLGHLSSPWTLQREWRKEAASPIHHFVCILFPLWPCLNQGLHSWASPCASTSVAMSPCLTLPGRDRYQVLKYYCCSPAGGCWRLQDSPLLEAGRQKKTQRKSFIMDITFLFHILILQM